jgi:hypothetical protein
MLNLIFFLACCVTACSLLGCESTKGTVTMKECRDRLALPAGSRPKSDVPGENVDAICANMLNSPQQPSSGSPAPPGAASQPKR